MEKIKKDAHSEEVNAIIMKDIDFAAERKQLGTPAMNIGEEFEMGIPEDGYAGLKKWLIKHGGVEKHLF
jgi:hypothetical protein